MGQNAAKIIGKPYQLNNIEVARNDFKNVQTWNDAIAKCKGLGEGWRLPTKDELNKLFNNKKKIGGFKDGLSDYYWSVSETATMRGSRISAVAVRCSAVNSSHTMFAPLGLNNY